MNLHLKTSFAYIKRSPFQALSAIFVLALTFFLGTVIALIVYSSSKLVNYFETRPQVIAFLKETTKPEEVSALQSKLENDMRLKNVKYMTKEEALEIYKTATKDNPLLAELVSPSIFPASLEFSVVDLKYAKEVIEEVKTEAIVESVGFTASIGGKDALSDVVERLKTITLYVRIGGGALVLVLGATSFLVLTVIIGMRVTGRRGEIESLSLIGAKESFIRAPITFEALNYSLIGVFTGWILAVILILYSTPTILSYFGDIPVLPQKSLYFFGLLGAILGAEILIGILISWAGSSIAITRALKNK